MKKSIITLFVLVFSISYAYTQEDLCIPDQNYAFEEGNIYPEAYHARYNPDGGILDSACINKEYSFTFTTVVPDSFLTSFGMVKLDSIVIEENGILFVPDGIKYKCNPPNCKFESGTLGCLELYGTPKPGNEIKIYDLKIKAKITVLDGLGVIRDTLPDYLTDSAHYYLPLFEENSPNCQTNSIYDLSGNYNIDIKTNPIIDRLSFNVEVPQSGDLNYFLYTLQGKECLRGNTWIDQYNKIITKDISDLKTGIYFLRTTYKGVVKTRKVIIL